MVAVDKNKFPSHISSELCEQILSAFSSHHRFTWDRFTWVCNWVTSDKGGKRKFCEDRWSFLLSIWKNELFRPFDDVESSKKFLESKKHIGFLIRLSTSKPGKITISYKLNEEVRHTRYKLIENGALKGIGGKKYENLQVLADKTNLILRRKNRAFYRKNEEYKFQVAYYNTIDTCKYLTE